MDNYTNLSAVTLMTKTSERDPGHFHASVYAKHTHADPHHPRDDNRDCMIEN